MAHFAPHVVRSTSLGLQGVSLGFHAYSLRIDNLSNQWLQEASTLVWIPPYSLGVVVKLWGTSVALLVFSAPVGQAQQAPIGGEYAVAVYSDEYRAENPGVPVRQFTLVQAVSDLTEGPQPAFPPVGVCRLWADANGNLFHLHSDGTDPEIWDTRLPLGGILSGTLPNAQLSRLLTMTDLAAGAASAGISSGSWSLSGSTIATSPGIIGGGTQVSLASQGYPIMILTSGLLYCSGAGQTGWLAMLIDGASWLTMASFSQSTAGYGQEVSAIATVTPTAGNHTFQLGWYVSSGGTLNLGNAAPLTLQVFELRR